MGAHCNGDPTHRGFRGVLVVAILLSIFSSGAFSQNGGRGGRDYVTAFPAAKVNEKLPEWVQFGGEYRLRYEDHTAYKFTPGN